jgi:hypothetical protein
VGRVFRRNQSPGWVAIALLLGCLFLAHFVGQSVAKAASLDDEQAKADRLVQAIPVTEVLGPLAPIALSPFFALSCLSGASLLVEAGVLPENSLLSGNSVLSNELVFLGLLGLTVVTALPKLTKVTKPLAQAIDQVEGYSGIIAVLLVQAAASFGGSEGGQEVVYQAGIFSVTLSTLLMAVSVVNIFVINTVKFFFEVMVMVSPFPAVDAAFEAANKAFSAALLGIYVYSPTLATTLNFIIFGICLLMFGWVFRRTVYYKAILGDPLLGFFSESIFRRRPLGAMSTRAPTSVLEGISSPSLVMKVFPLSSVDSIKSKARCYLVAGEDGIQLARPRFLRSPVIVKIGTGNVTIDRGILTNTITWGSDGNPIKVVFSRRYNGLLTEIASALGSRSEGIDSHRDRPRDLVRAARGASDGELKAELT